MTRESDRSNDVIIRQLIDELYKMFDEVDKWRHWYRTMRVEVDVALDGKTRKIGVMKIVGKKNIRNWKAK